MWLSVFISDLQNVDGSLYGIITLALSVLVILKHLKYNKYALTSAYAILNIEFVYPIINGI